MLAIASPKEEISKLIRITSYRQDDLVSALKECLDATPVDQILMNLKTFTLLCDKRIDLDPSKLHDIAIIFFERAASLTHRGSDMGNPVAANFIELAFTAEEYSQAVSTWIDILRDDQIDPQGHALKLAGYDDPTLNYFTSPLSQEDIDAKLANINSSTLQIDEVHKKLEEISIAVAMDSTLLMPFDEVRACLCKAEMDSRTLKTIGQMFFHYAVKAKCSEDIEIGISDPRINSLLTVALHAEALSEKLK